MQMLNGLMLLLLVLCCSSARANTVLVLGDSLSAAYGISESEGWVQLLQAQVKAQGRGISVINASISGETSAGGLARVDELLTRHRPQLVVLELGANDGLRGLPVKQVRANLEAIVLRSKAAKARVLLLGIELPINYGTRYRLAFRQMFADLAKIHKTGFVPFFIVDIADNRSNFQADGIHPTAAAQPKILARVWPALEPMLK